MFTHPSTIELGTSGTTPFGSGTTDDDEYHTEPAALGPRLARTEVSV